MSIIVGYVPTSAGEATLAVAAEKARVRSDRLVVVSVTRRESVVDPSQPQPWQSVLLGAECPVLAVKA